MTSHKRASGQLMRFRIQPRDVPLEVAARRLGKTRAEFEAVLPDLLARGFPQADPTTGYFDLQPSTVGAMPSPTLCLAVGPDVGARCRYVVQEEDRGYVERAAQPTEGGRRDPVKIRHSS